MTKEQSGPLNNEWILVSFLGFIIAYSIWKLSPSWGFLIVLLSIIIFFATFISAVRAPLKSDEEIELAFHEKYAGRRYPDTDLHDGLLPRQKKYLHSTHKKKLVELHLKKKTTKKTTKTNNKKTAKKKQATKTTTRKTTKKKTKRRR